jgi:hypothetical protein
MNWNEPLTDGNGITRSMAEWACERGIPLESIWEQVGCWVITTFGLECLTLLYPIPAHTLDMVEVCSWPEHMADKYWVNIQEFVQAWERSLVLHGKSRPSYPVEAITLLQGQGTAKREGNESY